jgi:hypothetical protein
MNNKPVAWIDPKELDMDVSTSVTKNKQFESDIPLYTYPAELTDRIAELEKQLDTRTRELIGASFYEHDYKTLMAKPPLTDKEIEEVAVINLGHSMGLLNWMGFARAILRKAQNG